MTKKIGLISGSLRNGANSTKILENVKEMLPDGYEGELIDINLPLYNEDLDQGNPPQEYVEYREKLDQVDGIIFATPEYNRTIPASIKNAIDVGSRPYGQSKLDGLPVGVISSSPSGYGGMAANHALRQAFVFTNMIPLQQPEMYLANVTESFDENGKFIKDTRDFVQGFVDAYIEHLEQRNN